MMTHAGEMNSNAQGVVFKLHTVQHQHLKNVYGKSILQTEACLSTLVPQQTLTRRNGEIDFRNQVHTPTKACHRHVTKIDLLHLFQKTIAVYCNNHKKDINAPCL